MLSNRVRFDGDRVVPFKNIRWERAKSMTSQIEDPSLSAGSGQFAILRGLIAAKKQLRPRMLITQSLSRR